MYSENSNGLAVVRRPMDKFRVEGCARSVFFVSDACAICTVCARSVLFVRDFYSCAICARFVSFVHDIYYSCAIIMLFVRDIYYRVRSVRDLCAICASLCAPRAHDVFVGPGFESLTMQHDLFTGHRFNSQAWLPVSGQ